MAYSRELFERAEEIINQRRMQAESQAEKRRRDFSALEPRYPALQRELAQGTMKIMQVIGMGKGAADFVEQHRTKCQQMQQGIRDLLKEHGLPADYLQTKYNCPICEDSGVDGSHYCQCMKLLLKELAYKQASERSPLTCSRFEDFSLHYYSGEQKAHMQKILNYCREYADTFDGNSFSLLFYGETGLGKTHLSLSVAGILIEKGLFVLYDSTQNIMNRLERERFGRGTSEGEYEKMLFECDLLILDDLGTEFSTQFTISALYNIINNRLLSGKPTIISTNLDLKGIEEKYTKRIASRIVGEYELLHFLGSDIRQQKKAEL